MLWGGWLLTAGVFFSIAGLFHEYYLALLGPPLAALVGIAATELWRVHQRHSWRAVASSTVLLLAAAGTTLWLQLSTARTFTNAVWWLPVAGALFVIGTVLLAAVSVRAWRRMTIVGFGCVLAAMLITPGIWSALTTINSSANQSLPAAYGGPPSGPTNGGGLRVNQNLLDYLETNTQGVRYLMAVPSSMQGADYILATGRPVLYLGGFSGQDNVVGGDDLSRLVADGELRYIYWSANGGGGFPVQGRQAEVSSWVTANCTPVQGFDTQTQNSGAPDGTGPRGSVDGGPPFVGPGGMQVSLYQCGTGAGS